MNNLFNFPGVDRLIEQRRNSNRGSQGFILASPDSDRHIITKEQIMSILQNTDDEVVVLDTNGEYARLSGWDDRQQIQLSCYPMSNIQINPFDVNLTTDDAETVISMKSDFIIRLCSILFGREGLSDIQKTLIKQGVRKIYEPLLKSKNEKTGEYDYSLIPTIGELYRFVSLQSDFDAHLLATTLECFVSGSLNLFARETNVEHCSRLVVYDLHDMMLAMQPMALMVVLNHILSRYVQAARSQGKRVWIFIDEVSPLFLHTDSFEYLTEVFVRAKQNDCSITGITTHVDAVTYADEGQPSILSHCNYLHLMNLPPYERKVISRFLNLTEKQESALTKTAAQATFFICGVNPQNEFTRCSLN